MLAMTSLRYEATDVFKFQRRPFPRNYPSPPPLSLYLARAMFKVSIRHNGSYTRVNIVLIQRELPGETICDWLFEFRIGRAEDTRGLLRTSSQVTLGGFSSFAKYRAQCEIYNKHNTM